MNFDFKNMETYHYFIYGGAGLAILAILGYFLSAGKVKLPAIIASSLSCLVLGIAAGVLLLASFGYTWKSKQESDANVAEEGGKQGAPKGGMPKGGMPKGGMPKGGGPQAPSPTTQLVQLITKLNLLTDKPLSVQLSDDRKKKIAEQIKDLSKKEALDDDEAETRLKAILEVIKEDRATMEAAGYRWPVLGGSRPNGPPKAPVNPFKDEAAAKELKALQDRVEK
jgi:hypothetical protein